MELVRRMVLRRMAGVAAAVALLTGWGMLQPPPAQAQAQAGAGEAGGPQGAPGAQGSQAKAGQDDVLDAEFEEVKDKKKGA